MANVQFECRPGEAEFLASSFPQYLPNRGTNFPVSWLAYDAAATESAFWDFTGLLYGGGNLTLDLIWGAATATSGVVRWEAAIAAITPETDSQDPETKAFATAHTVDDTHLGTTAKRLHRATITVSNLDSLAANDEVWLRISRIGGNAADTMTGDAWLRKVIVTYTSA